MLNKILKKDKYIAIFAIVTLFLALGASYAIVVWTTINYNIALDSSCMDINYVKGKNINATVGGVRESSVFSGSNITMHHNMAFTTVDMELDEDCADIDGQATIKINITNLSNDFKNGGTAYGHLKYIVAEYNPTEYQTLDMDELEGQSFSIMAFGTVTNEGTFDAFTTYLEPGNKKNYLIIMYVQELNVVASGTFSASIDTEVVQVNDLPDVTPISNFTYYIGTYKGLEIPDGYVLLTSYNQSGWGLSVRIPEKYTINGVDYRPIVSSNSCFKNKSSIYKVYFPANITFYYYDGSIFTLNSANELFSGCRYLKEVYNLGTTVNDLHSAFYNCRDLKKVPEIPSSVINMSSTFYGCTSLVNAPTIPSSVTNMSSTFYGCTSLVNASTIPSSVKIMSDTFCGCTNLTGTVRINSTTIYTLDDHAFRNTTKPITVEVPSGSTTYTSMNRNKPGNVTIVTY